MPDKQKIIIAIDGKSSCGKSTLAKELSRKLGYRYIDTGAMYRAVTLYFIRNNVNLNDDNQIKQALAEMDIDFKVEQGTGNQLTCLNGEVVEEDIRTMEVSRLVSPVSTIEQVRNSMVSQQQKMGRRKGVIMDGRDIGTVVFPDAELKLFLTAEEDERIRRRKTELEAKGEDVTWEEVKENLLTRDHIDSTRIYSPLRKAEDAIELDNTNLTPGQQVEYILSLVNERVFSSAQ